MYGEKQRITAKNAIIYDWRVTISYFWEHIKSVLRVSMTLVDIPKLAHHAEISAALGKYGQIKKSGLSMILNYGTGPQVSVVALANACGEFSPGSRSNELRLHRSLVDAFERSAGDTALLKTVGATILHELVHWGDDQDGIDYPGEEGELFEKHVYSMTQHHCAHFYPSLIRKGVVF